LSSSSASAELVRVSVLWLEFNVLLLLFSLLVLLPPFVEGLEVLVLLLVLLLAALVAALLLDDTPNSRNCLERFSEEAVLSKDLERALSILRAGLSGTTCFSWVMMV
jgi:hypothetical protein